VEIFPQIFIAQSLMVCFLNIPNAVEFFFHHVTVGEQPLFLKPQMLAILNPVQKIFAQGSAAGIIHLGFQLANAGFHHPGIAALFNFESAVVAAPLGHFQKNQQQVFKRDFHGGGLSAQFVDTLAFVGGDGFGVKPHQRGKLRDALQPAGAPHVQFALLAMNAPAGFLGLAHAAAFGRQQRLVKNPHRMVNGLDRAALAVQFQRHQPHGGGADIQSQSIFHLTTPNCCVSVHSIRCSTGEELYRQQGILCRQDRAYQFRLECSP